MTAKQDEICELWDLLGKSSDDPQLKQLLIDAAKPQSLIKREREEAHAKKVREAELVLRHLHHLQSMQQVKCQNCGEYFATNYEYNKHCSDECLRRTMLNLGLRWDPEKTPEQRWEGQPPSTITPVTLQVLKKWAKVILEWDGPVKMPPKKLAPHFQPTDDPYEFLKSLQKS